MKPEVFLNTRVSRSIGVREVAGKAFGIELELEGRNVGLNDVATRGWHRHHEPSLRGESIEYVTAGPKTFDEVQKLVGDLFTKFKKLKVDLKNSLRTSTHVHLNFSDRPIKDVIKFFALFTLLEEVLQYYCGEERKGNHFCISTREAEGIIGILAQSIGAGTMANFAGDRYKYAACNLSCLYKFGTVEVRTMRGANTADQVNEWLSILNDMYEYSLKMESPGDLVRDLSHFGAMKLMENIFTPKNLDAVMKPFPIIATLHHSLMEGARIIQVFSYEFDDAFKAKVKEEPVIEKKAKNGELPVIIQQGPLQGLDYVVYRPDGTRWHMQPAHGGLVWRNGDICVDDPHLRWNAARGRFVWLTDDGEFINCRWKQHHAIPDEGPPLLHLQRPIEVEFEPDPEPEWDDDDEEEDF